jgi:hypothetical protein
VAGNQVSFTDYAGTFSTNNLSINPNSNNLNGASGTKSVTTNRATVTLVYIDSTQGWISTSNVTPT